MIKKPQQKNYSQYSDDIENVSIDSFQPSSQKKDQHKKSEKLKNMEKQEEQETKEIKKIEKQTQNLLKQKEQQEIIIKQLKEKQIKLANQQKNNQQQKKNISKNYEKQNQLKEKKESENSEDEEEILEEELPEKNKEEAEEKFDESEEDLEETKEKKIEKDQKKEEESSEDEINFTQEQFDKIFYLFEDFKNSKFKGSYNIQKGKKTKYFIMEDLKMVQAHNQQDFEDKAQNSIAKELTKSLKGRSQEAIRSRYRDYLKYLNTDMVMCIVEWLEKHKDWEAILCFNKKNKQKKNRFHMIEPSPQNQKKISNHIYNQQKQKINTKPKREKSPTKSTDTITKEKNDKNQKSQLTKQPQALQSIQEKKRIREKQLLQRQQEEEQKNTTQKKQRLLSQSSEESNKKRCKRSDSVDSYEETNQNFNQLGFNQLNHKQNNNDINNQIKPEFLKIPIFNLMNKNIFKKQQLENFVNNDIQEKENQDSNQNSEFQQLTVLYSMFENIYTKLQFLELLESVTYHIPDLIKTCQYISQIVDLQQQKEKEKQDSIKFDQQIAFIKEQLIKMTWSKEDDTILKDMVKIIKNQEEDKIEFTFLALIKEQFLNKFFRFKEKDLDRLQRRIQFLYNTDYLQYDD